LLYATKGKRKLDKSMPPPHLADFYGSNASRTRRVRISRRERTLLYATKGKRKLDKVMRRISAVKKEKTSLRGCKDVFNVVPLYFKGHTHVRVHPSLTCLLSATAPRALPRPTNAKTHFPAPFVALLSAAARLSGYAKNGTLFPLGYSSIIL